MTHSSGQGGAAEEPGEEAERENRVHVLSGDDRDLEYDEEEKSRHIHWIAAE